MIQSAEVVQEQRRLYGENFALHGDTPRGIFWNNRETQRLRFEKLLHHFATPSRQFALHDVGCGVCDLHGYLLEKGILHDYSGTEIVPEMIAAAKAKYPGVVLHNRDILSGEVSDRYDVVVLSGALNLPGRIPRSAWEAFCFRMIERMFSMCRQGIAFNFLTTHSTFTDPSLFYMNPAEVLEVCVRRLSRFVFLDHAYPLYEHTVTVLRKEFVRGLYPGSAMDKYFRA